MQFSNEFAAPAAPDEVFATLMDVRGVAGCLPGASIGGDTEDGGLEATVAVKVGPIRMSYGGTVHVIERDDAARTATMRVRAREQRGQGMAEATLGLAVAADDDGGSRATVTTDLMVTGRIAQMGAGIMQDVAGSMVNDFASCLSARMGPAPAPAAAPEAPAATPPPPAPEVAGEVKALPLLWKALMARLGRLFGRR
ncbi:MAG: SRPBCC family protein [Gaiellales bacterium]